MLIEPVSKIIALGKINSKLKGIVLVLIMEFAMIRISVI